MPRKRKGENITKKQRRFILEYLKDLNATQAAIRAGYSQKTARKIGNNLLSHSGIKIEVEKLTAQIAMDNEVSVSWVVKKMVNLYETTEKDAVKLGCLEFLGKWQGMLKEQHEVTHSGEVKSKVEVVFVKPEPDNAG